MFIDASAIVAILAEEPEHEALLAALNGSDKVVSSVVSLFEAVLGLSKHLGAQRALKAVEEFVAIAEVEILPVDARLLPPLLDAHVRYGKGTRHPARLNMGDCYSYALARREGLPLLYKGDDFARTDLA